VKLPSLTPKIRYLAEPYRWCAVPRVGANNIWSFVCPTGTPVASRSRRLSRALNPPAHRRCYYRSQRVPCFLSRAVYRRWRERKRKPMMSQQPPSSAAKQNPERATTPVPRPISRSVLEPPQRRMLAQRLAVLIARIRQAQQEGAVDER